MMKKICTDGNIDGSSLFSVGVLVTNEDLVRQIFLRLPVRSLIRFKLVSKHWSSLISDPQFAQDWTRQLDPNTVIPSGLYFYNYLSRGHGIMSVSFDDSPIRVPSLSFLNTAAGGAKFTILQSCNGLLLCQFTSAYRKECCVCNPTTKKYKILPQHILNPREKAYGFTLAFDPSISPHYKVVCLIIVSSGDMKIELYSSETGQWNTSTYISCQDHYEPLLSSGLYWKRSLQWIEYSPPCYYSYKYDLEKKKFKRFNLADNIRSVHEKQLLYSGESKGHLHLILVRNNSPENFQVLERRRGTLKWSTRYRVHISRFVSMFPEICVKQKDNSVGYAFSIISVYKGEKEADSALVLSIPGKVVSYNLHDNTTKVLRTLPSHDIKIYSRRPCSNGFNFIQSLASV